MMTETRTPAWPRRLLTFRMLGLVLALASAPLWLRLWQRTAGPVERFYLWSYTRTSLGIPSLPSTKHRLPVFLVLETAGKTMTPVSYRLNPSAPISLHPMEFRPQFFGDWLRSYVYAGKPLSTVLLCPRSALAFVSLGWWELVSGSIGHTHGRRETGGCCAARRWQRGGLTTAQ